MKLKFVIGGGIILAALAYMVFGVLGQNLVFFITPSQYFQDPTRYQGHLIRLGGLVEPGSVHFNPQTLNLSFVLTDGVKKLLVLYRGNPPAMFKPDQGVVVQGRFNGGTFLGDDLLIKHSGNYAPPPPNASPQQLQQLIKETTQ